MAPRFYGAQELDIVDIAFRIKPALVWLVTLTGLARALRYSPWCFRNGSSLIRASLSGYRELPWNGDDPGKSGP